jgi:hypothetical protein
MIARKKLNPLSAITSRADAIEMITKSRSVTLFWGAPFVAMGAYNQGIECLVYAALHVMLAVLLDRFKSRLAGVSLVAVSATSFVTILSAPAAAVVPSIESISSSFASAGAGTTLIASIRATEALFKLRGRFSDAC